MHLSSAMKFVLSRGGGATGAGATSSSSSPSVISSGLRFVVEGLGSMGGTMGGTTDGVGSSSSSPITISSGFASTGFEGGFTGAQPE